MLITSAKDFSYIIIIFFKCIIPLAKMWRLLFSWQRQPSQTTDRFHTDNRKQNLLPSVR